jgi:hypothetical protein
MGILVGGTYSVDQGKRVHDNILCTLEASSRSGVKISR